ncbi:MAG: hypothetical protein Q4C64_00455 [Erysipelotrichia bacterium]|nr:hypothetical protein [Erysipelotrichia bacterium]
MKKKLEEILENIKNNVTVPQGYMQLTMYRVTQNIFVYALLWQALIYYFLLERVFATKWIILICFINFFITYYLIAWLFVDCYENDRQIYHLEILEKKYNSQKNYIDFEQKVSEEIKSGNRKCNLYQTIIYWINQPIVSLFITMLGIDLLVPESISKFVQLIIMIVVILIINFVSQKLFSQAFKD